MNKIFLFLLLINIAHTLNAQDNNSIKERSNNLKLIKSIPYNVWDVAYVQNKDWDQLYRIPNHPAFDSLLTKDVEQELLAKINQRRKMLDRDTLYTSDYFYVWKPYFEWLHNIDPHYTVTTVAAAPNPELMEKLSNNFKAQKRLPFHAYSINDSIVIRTSYDEKFKTGDLITAINGIAMSKLSKHYYNDRYTQINGYLLNYNFEIASNSFDLSIIRDGKELNVNTEGKPLGELFRLSSVPEEYNPTIYNDSKCGYIQIKEFYSDNSRLIKIVTKELNSFKKQGVKNVIIDITRNPGGSGDCFDKLLSIFINKPQIDYLRGQKLRVSEETLGDYNFLTKEMIGKTINIPDEYVMKSIKLDNRKFISDLNYYVLISENTGSVAASFANIMQYNGAAILAGEPLKPNALKYGETVAGNPLSYTLLHETGISTTEFDEHTTAKDGVLYPDIHIPYVASEYMTGKDAVLEKLLEIIKNR